MNKTLVKFFFFHICLSKHVTLLAFILKMEAFFNPTLKIIWKIPIQVMVTAEKCKQTKKEKLSQFNFIQFKYDVLK